MRSLHRTLVLGTTLGTTGVLVAAGIVLYASVRAGLIAQFDRSLLDKAQWLASTVEQEQGRIEWEFDELGPGEFLGKNPETYTQLRTRDGKSLYQSPSLIGPILGGKSVEDSPVFGKLTLPDGRPGRAVCIIFKPRQEGNEVPDFANTHPVSSLELALARSTVQVNQTLAHLQWILMIVGAASVAASAAILSGLIRYGLSPLDLLAGEIANLQESDLSRRIGDRPAPRELQAVVEKLNDLLARLDDAFRRERALSANVAHELRNPLAGLRLQMDVATARVRRPEDYEACIDQCRQIAIQMERMVENLLSLARLEAGQIAMRPDTVRLDRFIRELWSSMEARANQRNLHVQWSVDPELVMATDTAMLSIMVSNVLENAMSYAECGGSVRVSANSTSDAVRILVANSGSNLSQDEVEKAFEPFWRKDKARRAPGTHCGLGLSLVRKTVAVLGGSVSVNSREGGEFEIELLLPRRRDP